MYVYVCVSVCVSCMYVCIPKLCQATQVGSSPTGCADGRQLCVQLANGSAFAGGKGAEKEPPAGMEGVPQAQVLGQKMQFLRGPCPGEAISSLAVHIFAGWSKTLTVSDSPGFQQPDGAWCSQYDMPIKFCVYEIYKICYFKYKIE